MTCDRNLSARHLAAIALSDRIAGADLVALFARLEARCALSVRDAVLIDGPELTGVGGQLHPERALAREIWLDLVADLQRGDALRGTSVGFLAEVRGVLSEAIVVLMLIDGPVPRALGDALRSISGRT